MVRKRITAFAGDHGLPEERFYNLLCLAFGADPVQFADAEDDLPSTRSKSANLNTVHWSLRSIRKSCHVSIAKWEGGY